MPSQLHKYRVDGDTEIDEAWFNRFAADIDGRITALEGGQANTEKVIDELIKIGLERINEVLKPAFDEIEELAHLGDLLNASSDTELTIGTGTQIFYVVPDDRQTFAAPLYVVAAVSGETDKWMAGRVLYWNEESGELQVDVTNTRGAGTYADWDISVASIPPDTPPAQTASNVNFSPAGAIEADTVQAAIEELDSEKASVGHDHAGTYAPVGHTHSDLAPKNSPEFTGEPKAPTPANGDSSTKVPTTAFVTNAIANGVIVDASFTDPGYAVFAGGLVLQWGTFDHTGGNYTTFTWPMAFPNAFLSGSCVSTQTNKTCEFFPHPDNTLTQFEVGLTNHLSENKTGLVLVIGVGF